jgi:hypothetical protein
MVQSEGVVRCDNMLTPYDAKPVFHNEGNMSLRLWKRVLGVTKIVKVEVLVVLTFALISLSGGGCAQTKNVEGSSRAHIESSMNYPAASSGVSMHDSINFNVASDGVLDPSFAINLWQATTFTLSLGFVPTIPARPQLLSPLWIL